MDFAGQEPKAGERKVMAVIRNKRALEDSRTWKVLFYGTAFSILLWSACWRFSLPLAPVANKDLSETLNPAILALTGSGFHQGSQPFVYPAILYLLLGIFKDFRSIVFLSHLLGLGTGVLLLATWRLAVRLLRRSFVYGWMLDAAGLGMFAVWLFAPMPLQLEYDIHPDGICPFFAALSLFATAQFLHVRTCRVYSPGWALAWGGLALVVAFLLPTLKPSYWISCLLATIPIWIVFFDSRVKFGRRAFAAGITLTAIASLLLMARHFAHVDPANAAFFPESVFSIHALAIREQIAADVMTPDPANPYSASDLESTLRLLDAGIQASRAASPHGFPTLGYDADQLLHHGPFFSEMARHGRSQWALGLYRYYYLRTWWKRPQAMAAKVVTQLGLFYNLDCPAFHGRRVSLRSLYHESAAVLADPFEKTLLLKWPPAIHALEAQALAESRAPENVRISGLLNAILDLLGATYFPVFLLSVAALCWVLAHSELRVRFGAFTTLLMVCFGYNVGNNLVIAIFHTLEVGRYSFVQFGTALFGQFVEVLFLVEFIAEVVARTYSQRGAKRDFWDAREMGLESDPN